MRRLEAGGRGENMKGAKGTDRAVCVLEPLVRGVRVARATAGPNRYGWDPEGERNIGIRG